MKARQIYTQDFREMAVSLALSSSETVAQVASGLGITPKTLRQWISRSGKTGTVKAPARSAEAEENRRLKKELAIVKEERDILKKATAYFARHSV